MCRSCLSIREELLFNEEVVTGVFFVSMLNRPPHDWTDY